MNILVTNDDGCDSPLLIPFLDALKLESWAKQITPVIPDQEQSWISSAMHRFKPIKATKRLFGVHEGYALDGFPSDCTSIGISNLGSSPFDMVLSGINFGINAGLPFYLCSGTVGGAVQGFLLGLPSIAISAHVPREFWPLKNENPKLLFSEYHAEWKNIALASARTVRKIIQAKAHKECDLISINIPWNASADAEIVVTEIERGAFKQIFRKIDEDVYLHRITDEDVIIEAQSDTSLAGDLHTVVGGKISVTPVRYNLTHRQLEVISKFKKAFGG